MTNKNYKKNLKAILQRLLPKIIISHDIELFYHALLFNNYS